MFADFFVCFLLWQNAEGNANVEMALKNPARYVLKPEREGGGKLLLLIGLLLFANSLNTNVLKVMITPLRVKSWSLWSVSISTLILTEVLRSAYICTSVCLSVCLSAGMSHMSKLHKFSERDYAVLPVAVAQSSYSDDSAIRYVPVLKLCSVTLPEIETELKFVLFYCLYCFIVQLVYVSHYIVSFILLYCNFHLSFNHCFFTLLCVRYVLFYCTNPTFGCYISIKFLRFLLLLLQFCGWRHIFTLHGIFGVREA